MAVFWSLELGSYSYITVRSLVGAGGWGWGWSCMIWLFLAMFLFITLPLSNCPLRIFAITVTDLTFPVPSVRLELLGHCGWLVWQLRMVLLRWVFLSRSLLLDVWCLGWVRKGGSSGALGWRKGDVLSAHRRSVHVSRYPSIKISCSAHSPLHNPARRLGIDLRALAGRECSIQNRIRGPSLWEMFSR